MAGWLNRTMAGLILFLGLTGPESHAQQWQDISPNVGFQWNVVHFFTPDSGFVAGLSSQIARTADGGSTWETTQLQPTPGAPLNGLSMIRDQPSNGWLVGNSGRVRKTIDAGQNWEFVTPSPIAGNAMAVHFPIDTMGWLVTHDGSTWQYSGGGDKWTLWGKVPLGNPGPLNTVYFIHPDTGWVAGAHGHIARTFNGARWPTNTVNWTTFTQESNLQFNDVFFFNVNDGWACGTFDNKAVILRSTNGGQTWTKTVIDTVAGFNSLAFIHPDTGWVAGSGGSIYRTVNGGQSWNLEVTGITQTIRRLHMHHATLGWAVGGGGKVLRYTRCDDARAAADPVCQGDTLFLQSETEGAAYHWTGPDNFQSDTRYPIRFPAVGGTYHLTLTQGACVTTDSVVVTLRTLPEIQLSAGARDCDLGQRALHANGNFSQIIAWQGPGGFSAGNLASVQIIMTGTYGVTATSAEGCRNEATIVITSVAEKPNLGLSVSPAVIDCNNPAVTIQAQSDTLGTIFFIGGNPMGMGQLITQQSGSYTIEAEHPVSGCRTSGNIMVPIDTLRPTLTLPGNDILTCTKESIILQAMTNATSVEWSKGGVLLATGPSLQVHEPGNYQVTVRGQNGCTASGTVLVSEDKQAPGIGVPAVSGPITCKDPSVTLSIATPDPGVEILWTGPGGFQANTATVSVTLPGDYSVRFTSIGNGCQAMAEITVASDLVPPSLPQGSLSVSGKVTCRNEPVRISMSSAPAGVAFAWSTPSGEHIITDSAFIEVSSSGIYALTLTGSNGCFAVSGPIHVEADTLKPDLPILTDITVDCGTETILLPASSNQGDSSLWRNPGGKPLEPGTIGKNDIEQGYYVLTVVGPNGCISSDSLLVTTSGDIPTLHLSTDTTEVTLNCSVGQARIHATTNVPNGVITWTRPDGSETQGTSITVDQGGSYKVSVIDPATDCQQSRTMNVGMDTQIPISGIKPHDILTCQRPFTILEAETVALPANRTFSFVWLGPGGEEPTGAIIPVNESQTGTWGLTVTDLVNGCTNLFSTTVLPITDKPSVKVIIASLDCDSAVLEAKAQDTANLVFEWSPSPGISAQDLRWTVYQTGIYQLTATDTLTGCRVVLTPAVELPKPNLITFFSPNGDGKNDRFRVNLCRSMEVHGFTLFNRWGNLLLSTEDFDRDYPQGWDGTVNGKVVPNGTYYYILKTANEIWRENLTILE